MALEKETQLEGRQHTTTLVSYVHGVPGQIRFIDKDDNVERSVTSMF